MAVDQHFVTTGCDRGTSLKQELVGIFLLSRDDGLRHYGLGPEPHWSIHWQTALDWSQLPMRLWAEFPESICPDSWIPGVDLRRLVGLEVELPMHMSRWMSCQVPRPSSQRTQDSYPLPATILLTMQTIGNKEWIIPFLHASLGLSNSTNDMRQWAKGGSKLSSLFSRTLQFYTWMRLWSKEGSKFSSLLARTLQFYT